MLIAAISFALHTQIPNRDTVQVKTTAELRAAIEAAKPGTEISVAPGVYQGGLHLSNIHGTAGKPIIIRSTPRAGGAVFRGGGSGMQFSNVSYLEIDGLSFVGATGNGLNIDDGGNRDKPSHHIEMVNIRVSDLPKGNHDGIKLSGVTDFRVINAQISNWGGSGIDMVGCNRGEISHGTFSGGGDNGVQTKGGSSNILITRSNFIESGQRGVNIGGSTGREFFRPQLEKIPSGSRYEAKNISVEGCTFLGSVAPIAFVGVDGASVRFNTFFEPRKWVLRILQETNAPDFIACRNGIFEDNLVWFVSNQWSAGGTNIGGGTNPTSFKFARNFWYCADSPSRSKPTLPTTESDGVYGQNPEIEGEALLRGMTPRNPLAKKVGAHAYKEK